MSAVGSASEGAAWHETFSRSGSYDSLARTPITFRYPEQASEAIAHAYSPSKLDVLGPPQDFDFKLHLTELPGLNLGHISFGTNVRIVAPPPSCYVVCFAASGRLDVSAGRDSQVLTGSRGSVIHSGEVAFFENWSPDCEMVSIRIEQQELERRLASLLGSGPASPIRFDLALHLGSGETASLRHALRLLNAEATNPGGLLLNANAANVITELITTALLVSQPNNYSDALRGPAKPSAPGPVRAARDLIESAPMDVTTVGELASLVHSSVRALEEGFRKHLGVPPMTYLREVRLSRAHDALVHADPHEHTVANIARRWGFQHPSRFAQAYRAKFGELPTQTLRNGR